MSDESKSKDSMKNILVVALGVCFVCAVIVSGAAVSMKPQRLENKALDRSKNILIAAGLFEKGVTPDSQIDKLFEKFTLRVADLEEGRFLTDAEVSELGIDPVKYDQRKASKDPSLSKALSDAEDTASITRRARYSVVYLLKGEQGEVDRIVLPIHGYGLWSTLYGFIALEGDGNTVAGITFYEHAETAGLGGEVENPRWKALWEGKQIYENGEVALQVIKGNVDPSSPKAVHQVDGLSGASLTSRGVQNLVGFWMGENGFGPLLKKVSG